MTFLSKFGQFCALCQKPCWFKIRVVVFRIQNEKLTTLLECQILNQQGNAEIKTFVTFPLKYGQFWALGQKPCWFKIRVVVFRIQNGELTAQLDCQILNQQGNAEIKTFVTFPSTFGQFWALC